MALTEKQERFCNFYIEKGGASEAYRLAYDADGMNDKAVSVEAARLLANPSIALAIEELRKPVRERAQITLEAHLDDLKRLRNMAVSDKKYSAAISAEISRGKASGLYVDKVEHSGIDIPSIVINRPNGD